MKGTTVANEAKQKAMRDAIEVLIKRHDKQADEDNPIGPGEFGRMTCGCRDCIALKAVLAEQSDHIRFERDARGLDVLI